MTNILLYLLRDMFMSKDSSQYVWTEENGLPLIIYQALFLSVLSLVVMPSFFALYGSVVFGSYKMRVEKGFDQALYRADEGRLLQTTNANNRVFYDMYS